MNSTCGMTSAVGGRKDGCLVGGSSSRMHQRLREDCLIIDVTFHIASLPRQLRRHQRSPSKSLSAFPLWLTCLSPHKNPTMFAVKILQTHSPTIKSQKVAFAFPIHSVPFLHPSNTLFPPFSSLLVLSLFLFPH